MSTRVANGLVKLCKEARLLVQEAHDCDGRLHVYFSPCYSPSTEAVARLWVAGVFELVEAHGIFAAFRLTKDGEKLARVVCAA